MADHLGQFGNVVVASTRGEHKRDLFRKIDPDSGGTPGKMRSLLLGAGIDDHRLAAARADRRNLRDVRMRSVVQLSRPRKSMRLRARSSMRRRSAGVRLGSRLNAMRPKSSHRPLRSDRPVVR